jgi:hypothetical protein
MQTLMRALVVCAATFPCAAMAVVPISGPSPGSAVVTINNSPGQQFDPHVSGDLVSYMDLAVFPQIRYYNFANGNDTAIDNSMHDGTYAVDVLSDVNGKNVVFTQQAAGASRIMIFNTDTGTTTEVDPVAASAPPPERMGSAIGGNTVAYIDISNTGDVIAWDLATSTRQVVSAAPALESNPNVSPDGNVIVWEYCTSAVPGLCGGGGYYVFQAVKSGSGWVVSSTANTATQFSDPDTDGTTIVYDADRAGSATGQDIYFRPVAGGPETQIELPGLQRNPSISQGVVTFESIAPGATNVDIFLYIINTNTVLQVTNTPGYRTLNDVTVLANGDVHVVWAENDVDIVGTTFTPPLPRIVVAPADVNFGDVNVGATGSTIVTVSNAGLAPLTVSSAALAPTGGPFSITASLPAIVLPNATLDLPVSFSPTATVVSNATLSIASPGNATAQVPLTGRGVVSQPPPAQQIADTLAFFDASVAAGTLLGSGPGNAAKGRLGALRNMIEAAGDLIRRGLVTDACVQLTDVRNRTDGKPQPPDFVTGPAAAELLQQIDAIRATLGCM